MNRLTLSQPNRVVGLAKSWLDIPISTMEVQDCLDSTVLVLETPREQAHVKQIENNRESSEEMYSSEEIKSAVLEPS